MRNREWERGMGIGNGSIEPMRMGNREWDRTGNWEQGMGTGNGEQGLGMRTGNEEQGIGMGMGNEEQGIGIETGNGNGEWKHRTHGNRE